MEKESYIETLKNLREAEKLEVIETQELINREKFEEVAIRYLAKAQAHTENYPEQALVYATMANSFATIEAARASWAKV